ncbi:dachshund homolog 2 [Rhipicephalus sanguineus]|uniref:dachshund homolog 2 n=1 Tax=Rhipicephalus sanguineus TaxID=34632 RepID=UPI001895C179|nr:dachshund homolog 2 [Rhipicephalus sanguineus]
MDAGSLGSCSSGGGTPSPPTLTFGSPAAAAHSPSARGGSSPKSGFGSLTPTRSTPESPLGAALPPPPPPPKQPGYGVLHALNGGRALYGGMRPPPSPPGIPSDASATDCRLIDYRGAKVAAFLVNGEYLLCLPQAFELFLKHLVGGLHTVYTKLKRLDITPIVCNVEQVRILRGLGAIQPGVNRCKLLSCKDFDSLYKDCTTARSASRLWNAASLMGAGSSPANASYPFLSQEKRYPGEDASIQARSRNQARPPKRSSLMSMSPSNGSPLGMMSKKGRMDDYPGYENGHLAAEQADKPHHGGGGGALLPNGFSPQQAAAAAAAAHLNATLPFLALGSHPHPGGLLSAAMGIPLPGATPHHPLGGAAPSRTDHHLAKAAPPQLDPQAALRLRDDGGSVRDRNFSSYDGSRLKDSAAFVNGGLPVSESNGHGPPVLNLSQHGHRNSATRDYHDGAAADAEDDTEDDTDDRDPELSGAEGSSSPELHGGGGGGGGQGGPGMDERYALDAALGLGAVSSIETLLRNIQGLLKVAADNARHQDRQISIEKAELKMEVLRERGLRESLEKQLSEEQRTRVLYQKRLKKERRCRRRIQDQLELEQKKRSQYEEVLRNSAAADHRSPPAQSQPQPQTTHAQATQQLTPPERVPSPDMDPERHSRQESEKKVESTTSVG